MLKSKSAYKYETPYKSLLEKSDVDQSHGHLRNISNGK